MKKTFTQQQINQWYDYEQVRSSGAFNMLTPQAISASGLNKTDYFFVLENFDALKALALRDESEGAST